MVERLEKIGFQKSKIDDCVFYLEDMIFVVYVNDAIIFMKDKLKFKDIFSKLKAESNVEEKGDVEQFLGLHFSKLKDQKGYYITQTHLIDQIVSDVGLKDNNFKCPQSPCPSTSILHRNQNDSPFDPKLFHYRSVVGKLNYLEKSSRPDISYAVHQCARFSHDPKVTHGQAIIHLVKYLHGTRDKGIILHPNDDHNLHCHVDADFCGNWNKLTAMHDASTAKSRTGFVITYANCPVSWSSKLQTQVALSTTEAECIAMSSSLRDAIPIMNFLHELKTRGFINTESKTQLHCKVFEDNSGALEMARNPKMRPRTKHINVLYHWFISYIKDRSVKVYPVSSENQCADLWTKPLAHKLFVKHRKKILSW